MRIQPLKETDISKQIRHLIYQVGGYPIQTHGRVYKSNNGYTYAEDQEVKQLELGEFSELWNRGDWFTIGRDPACSIVLDDPEIPLIAAVVVGASNHLMTFHLPEGQTFPLPSRPQGGAVSGKARALGATETTRDVCRIGPYRIEFGETYREE